MASVEISTAPLTSGSPPLARSALVTLSDGTRLDLSRLGSEELRRLQWNQERDFARRIVAAPKGSVERAEVTSTGYDTICTILSMLRSDPNGSLVMGHDARYERLVLKLLGRKLAATATPQMFELGFGTGRLLAIAGRHGCEVAGLEVSPAMYEQARANLPPQHRHALRVGDFLQTDFTAEAGRYSLVYWNDVFEHVPPDEILDYLQKIYTLLAPGGRLVTITPNWHTRPSDITSFFHPPRHEAVGFHLKEYTLRETTALLRAAGFTRVATPLMILKDRMILCGNGGTVLKRFFEPLLELLPYRLAKTLCRGFGLYCTIATKR